MTDSTTKPTHLQLPRPVDQERADPIRIAAMPNQRKKKPGSDDLDAEQDQAEHPPGPAAERLDDGRGAWVRLRRRHRHDGAAGRPGDRHRPRAARRRGRRARRRRSARAISAMPPSAPMTPDASIGIRKVFWFGEWAKAVERLDVFLRDEIVDRLHVARGDRLAHHAASPWLPPRPRARAPRRRGTRLRAGPRPPGSAPASGPRPSGSPTAACLPPRGSAARFSRSAIICRAIEFDEVLAAGRCP